MIYKIGSRGSKLALAQTESVCRKLKKRYPEHTFEIVIVKTKGDKVQDKPLDQVGGKGIFVKEIEEMILSDEIQMGVHSMKDMPARPAEGLIFSKVWKREDPRDVLILREKKRLQELRHGAVIGTGSKRRAFQLKKLRPDLQVVGIRGNVDTRLRKMEEQKLDGIVLAAAGLHRLGMGDRISQYFSEEEMIPAPAQGVLALELRKNNEELRKMLDACADEESQKEASSERQFLEAMGGGCHVPVGASCVKQKDGTYRFYGMFGTEDGSRIVYESAAGSDPGTLAESTAAAIRRKMAGTVFLTGAGPGDPDLITVKGRKILHQADCVIYDRLADPGLLSYVKKDCEKIYVGKENRHHVMEQEEINRLLAQKAMEHKVVVRLKGGDPFVFGRGGEEAMFLKKLGIPAQIIPGISSCIAGPAYAGIPVTHRGTSGGFHVVTAHDRNNKLADIDFEGMARSGETCIFLMGFSKIGEIVQKLQEAGMSPHMPAAVISRAASVNQKTCIGTLETIEERVRKNRMEPPAVIVAGKTVELSAFIGTVRQQKPYLVTKIGTKPSRLSELLRGRGVSVTEIQTGSIVMTEQKFTKDMLQKASWLIFTSRNGVKGFMKNLQDSDLDVRCLHHTKIAAIGQKTAHWLKKCGLLADLVPQIYDSGHLAQCLKQKAGKQDLVCHIKGKEGTSVLRDTLAPLCKYHEIEVYENQPVKIEKPGSPDQYAGTVFTCASSVRRFFGSMEAKTAEKWKREMRCFSIGTGTTSALQQIGAAKICEALQADYESLAAVIGKDVEDVSVSED